METGREIRDVPPGVQKVVLTDENFSVLIEDGEGEPIILITKASLEGHGHAGMSTMKIQIPKEHIYFVTEESREDLSIRFEDPGDDENYR